MPNFAYIFLFLKADFLQCSTHCFNILHVLPGASLSSTDNEGLTALSWACMKGQKGTVQLLVELGADVNQPDRQGRTPLDIAALNGDTDTVGFMLFTEKDLKTYN